MLQKSDDPIPEGYHLARISEVTHAMEHVKTKIPDPWAVVQLADGKIAGTKMTLCRVAMDVEAFVLSTLYEYWNNQAFITSPQAKNKASEVLQRLDEWD